MNDDPGPSRLDLTANGVEFAAWPTGVENDDLALGKLSYDLGGRLVTLPEGRSIGLPSSEKPQRQMLEATFVSITKTAVIRFGFSNVIAFRVLDENGLVELWAASAASPRPTYATFRARGHKWADESFLVFLAEGDLPRFSYFVATDDACLEVVCDDEPTVTDLGPAVVSDG